MEPRCCWITDQRVGRRDIWSTSYWLQQDDETVRKLLEIVDPVELRGKLSKQTSYGEPNQGELVDNKLKYVKRENVFSKRSKCFLFSHMQPVLHGYFRSSCSWRVRIGKSCHNIWLLQWLFKALSCQQDDDDFTFFLHQLLLWKVLSMTKFQSILSEMEDSRYSIDLQDSYQCRTNILYIRAAQII